MKKENSWLLMHHVIMHGNNFDPIFNQSFDHRGHFLLKHGKISRHGGMIRRTLKGGPGVETQKSTHRCSVFLQRNVWASNGVFINTFAHLTFAPKYVIKFFRV